jgi:hypothetical protein
MRIDNAVDELTKDGYLAADSQTQEAAKRFAAIDPEGFSVLMKTPRPVAAQSGGSVVPVAPVADHVDAQIAALAAEKQIAYHEAALQVSQGSALSSALSSGAGGGTNA